MATPVGGTPIGPPLASVVASGAADAPEVASALGPGVAATAAVVAPGDDAGPKVQLGAVAGLAHPLSMAANVTTRAAVHHRNPTRSTEDLAHAVPWAGTPPARPFCANSPDLGSRIRHQRCLHSTLLNVTPQARDHAGALVPVVRIQRTGKTTSSTSRMAITITMSRVDLVTYPPAPVARP